MGGAVAAGALGGALSAARAVRAATFFIGAVDEDSRRLAQESLNAAHRLETRETHARSALMSLDALGGYAECWSTGV